MLPGLTAAPPGHAAVLEGPNRLAWITAVLAAGFLVSRFFLVSGGASLAGVYNGPDTRADELLRGRAVALVFTSISPGSRLHISLQSGVLGSVRSRGLP